MTAPRSEPDPAPQPSPSADEHERDEPAVLGAEDDPDEDAEAGSEREAAQAPDAKMYSTVPLEDEDGNTYVIRQQNVGYENMEGGGEFPPLDTPPRSPAPGAP